MTRRHVDVANRLAAKVTGRPAEEAATLLAAMLALHWDTRMRLSLYSQVDACRDGVSPLVMAAVAILRRPGARRKGWTRGEVAEQRAPDGRDADPGCGRADPAPADADPADFRSWIPTLGDVGVPVPPTP